MDPVKGAPGGRWLENLILDVRYAMRQLRRQPSFAVVAVLILALGIGATTTVFTVVNAVLLRPLPFEQPERLVRVAGTNVSGGLSGVTSRSSNLRDWSQLNESFEDLAGYFAFFDYQRFTLTGRGESERLVGVGITETFLDTLGVQPLLGRGFVAEECVWNGRPAALLTHGAWETRFGADSGIVGNALTLNGEAVTVVGVLPPSFDFASFFSPGSRIDFLQPFPVSDETDRRGNTLSVIGRLKPGVSMSAAQAELDLINERLQADEPNRWGLGAEVSNLRDHITGSFRDALILLALAVGLVLLVTCTNLSNLLLARAASRRKEIAVRSAIGAGRWRLIRQVLTEALVLSAGGGLLGVATAYGLTRAVAATQAVTIPLLQSVRIDGAALAFAVIIVVGTGLLFGLVPALQVSQSKEYDALRDSARGMSEGKGRAWLRGALVISEVALACVLLVGAGLLMRSFVVLLDTDLGFQPAQRVAWRVETTRQFENLPEKAQFYERMMRRVESIPGVESVGLTDTLPLGRNRSWMLAAKGQVYRDGEQPGMFPRMVSPGYIGAMGIRLIQGRDFTAHDTAERDRVVLLNEAAAQRLWPNEDPIGRRILNNGECTVVGVVANVRHGSLEEMAGNEVYFPISQQSDWGAADLVVRSKLPVESLVPSVRRALREVDGMMATGEFQTLGSIVDRAASPRRFIVSLLGAFAVAAVLLAALGIYGVISYSVSRRRQEIGIRMALGASPRNVRMQVMRRTLALATTGILAGILGSLVLARLMASLLYGVGANDPATFAITIAFLFVIAALAGYLPAHRASRIHPGETLQEV
jgi:putative ABC transport system permease protein